MIDTPSRRRMTSWPSTTASPVASLAIATESVTTGGVAMPKGRFGQLLRLFEPYRQARAQSIELKR